MPPIRRLVAEALAARTGGCAVRAGCSFRRRAGLSQVAHCSTRLT
jgi:hypothetical protein